MTACYREDIRTVADSPMIDWRLFRNQRVLITGGTGLLGRLLTQALLERNRVYGDDITVLLPVRSKEKAAALYGDDPGLDIAEAELTQIRGERFRADYILHCAAPTQSAFFVTKPVETIDAIAGGTKALLEHARATGCKGMVFLSSMEVFGAAGKEILEEEDLGSLSLTNLRSSYPEAKRLAELMCFAYAGEYDLPVKIARLAQTFGPGVDSSDGRVFMQFCKAIKEGTDIVLRTPGDGVINYCYPTDAVLGILKVLQCGQAGQAYSLVNDDPAVNLRQVAQWLIDTYGREGQALRFDFRGAEKYAVSNHSKISNGKARSIGWFPVYSVQQGYERLMKDLGVI